MILKERKVLFEKAMNMSLVYLTPAEMFSKFKKIVCDYGRNLEIFSKCDINNDKDFCEVLSILYKIYFLDDDFLTILSDQRKILFDRISKIMTNMIFAYEDIKGKVVYGHLCFDVAVAQDYNINLKTIYTASKLKKLEADNRIILYSKVVDLYESVPVAKPVIIEEVPEIYSMDLFDNLKDKQVLTESFMEKLEQSDLYSFFVDYLRVMFGRRQTLRDMKMYMTEFKKQFESFMSQDDEALQQCKEWYENSISKGILQKVYNKQLEQKN